MRIGILTGGGDCPGLNAVIRAVVRKGEGVYGHQIVGFRHGWRGVIEGETMELTIATTRGLIHRGGTILGTSRTNPFKSDDGMARVLDTLERERIDALIVIGGEDTLGVAAQLAAEGVAVVGVPEDHRQRPRRDRLHLRLPDRGADRERCHRPAAHHRREPRPRDRGRGDGSPRGLDRDLLGHGGRRRHRARPRRAVRHRRGVPADRAPSPAGANFSIVVVAEGAEPKEGTITLQSGDVDEFGHVRLGGISTVIQDEIERRTGFETRVTVLGHVLRGGTPTAYDRVLATRFGIAAIDAVHEGAFATMVALRGRRSSGCRSTTRCASSRPSTPSCSTPRASSSADLRLR